VDTLATQLWKLGIDVVYPNLDHGPTAPIPGTGGRAGWVHDPYAGRAFVAALHAQVPGLQVVPYKGWHDCEGLEGADWEAWIEERVEGFDASMTALGADGVQLDMECGNIDKPAVAPRFEAFLARLEARIGPDRVLSVAVPMLSQTAADYTEDRFKQAAWYGQQVSGDHPRDPRWTLTPATWERIFRHADQVVVMAYDTWYTPAQSASYQRMVAGQAWVGADFARSFRKEFLVGLRFSTADSPRKGMHYHSVENPTVGLGALAVLTAPDHPAAPLLERWLAGVSYYRLDATLEASYDARIGAPYLASVRGW
jgi:hypothetical protein